MERCVASERVSESLSTYRGPIHRLGVTRQGTDAQTLATPLKNSSLSRAASQDLLTSVRLLRA